jgi:CheY-like chemotaxis protein
MDDLNKDGYKIISKEKIINKTATKTPWKILIVDDEEATHTITKVVLKDLVFLEKDINFISVYSGAKAKEFIKSNEDTALILLDVVMEEEDSGLQVVKYIREELKNTEVRIVLRTAYPGSAPEKNVIINYDINDYKDKTELFSQKLVTCVISALRSYNDIQTIAELNRDLENKVIARTKQLEDANIKLAESLQLLKRNEKTEKKRK